MHHPSQPAALIVFHSRRGDTEKRALDAAVGVVEGRGRIRLRRVHDLAPGDVDEHEGLESIRRMRREYVPPSGTDAVWADAIVHVVPAYLDFTSPEWGGWMAELEALGRTGALRGKIGIVVCPDESRRAAMRNGLARLGLAAGVAPEAASAREEGRRIAAAARERA